MKNIFSQLQSVEAYLNLNADSVTKHQAVLFREIKVFVFSGSYTRYVKKDVFLKYVYCTDEVLALKLGIKKHAVRKLRSRISGEVYRLLGSDMCDILMRGTAEELRELYMRLKIARSDISSANLFSSELMGMIENAKLEERSFELEDCIPELVFLRMMSTKNLKKLILNLDIDRLAYIIRLLGSGKTDLAEKVKFVEFIVSSEEELKKRYGAEKIAFPPVRKEDK